jgi:hypothetical protein
MRLYILGFAAALVVAGSAGVAGQSKESAIPRTPDGKPDLQGVWDFRTITPMERPKELANKATLTEEEARQWEIQNRRNQDNREKGAARTVNGQESNQDVERAYNDFWWDRGTKVTTLRTSMVVDPPDGRVPPLTEEARKRQADEAKRPAFRGTGASGRGVDTWLDRSTFERCITRGLPGAMSPTAYNNNYRVTQAPGVVALEIEMLGGTRIIPTDGRPHINSSIRQWMGNSVGRWEGDTLVVETTNFTDKVLYRGAAENLHLVERIRRVGPGELEYRVTISDPTTFTRPWTLVIPYVNTGEQMFEYACHEGNYGMEGILSGAREDEKKAAEAKTAAPK